MRVRWVQQLGARFPLLGYRFSDPALDIGLNNYQLSKRWRWRLVVHGFPPI